MLAVLYARWTSDSSGATCRDERTAIAGHPLPLLSMVCKAPRYAMRRAVGNKVVHAPRSLLVVDHNRVGVEERWGSIDEDHRHAHVADPTGSSGRGQLP